MKRVIINSGMFTLDLTVADDVDFDDRFKAVCNDTGEALFVNGWLIEDIEEVEAA